MFKKKHSSIIKIAMHLILTAFLCMVMLAGCGGDDNGGDEGPIGSVSVSWSLECSEEDPLDFIAEVYDASNTYLTYGGPWDCSSESGLINQVPTGSKRNIVLFGVDNNGEFKYRGEKRNIIIEEDELTYAGDITLYDFVASLVSPENGITVKGSFSLAWDYVAGAVKYKIMVSDDPMFLNPIITEELNGPPFAPSDLNKGGLYFWKVSNVDIYGNPSADSEVWEFTIPAPLTTIKRPADGDLFTEYDEVYFLGEAIDTVDGLLTEDELVWSSNLDGIIGYGEVLEDILLPIGTHIITLRATNSLGWSSNDSITISIVSY